MKLYVVGGTSSHNRSPGWPSLSSAIRRALDCDELTLVWQPQVDLASNEVEGIEALVRWFDRERGAPVAPSEFIAVAERSNLIFEIDRFVLRTACLQGNALHDELGLPLRICVNISGAHFQKPDFPSVVAAILEETRFPAASLEVEITEGVLVENRRMGADVLRRLSGLGVHVALDDFGTGYSSLSYLADLKIDRLKIDRSFVRNIEQNRRKQAVLGAIVGMAEALGIETVAEGVETRSQVRALLKAGCTVGQGYLFSRPLEAARLVPWLTQNVGDRRHARRAVGGA